MKFGIATCDIVPPFPTSMGGYGLRDDKFDDAHDPLTFTALILQEGDRRVLIGAADIVTWPNDGRTEKLLERLGAELGIEPDQILLNASHTHGGPKLPGASIFSRQQGDFEAAERYADWLAEQVVATTRRAAATLRDGTLHHITGRTELPMNRRCLRDGKIVNAPNPGGPVDDAVHLLAIKDDTGKLAAVAMRLSCHPVCTGPQHRLTADFVGGWRTAFREALGPDVTPIFLQGSAGDMRPTPCANGDSWRFMAHAEMLPLGRTLLAEMLQTLLTRPWRQLGELHLLGTRRVASVPCTPLHLTPESLEPLLGSDYYVTRGFVAACRDLFARGETPPTSVDHHVHTLWLDDQLALVGLDCEPLIGLGAAIEQQFQGSKAIVMGYTNGCIGYAPDTVELQRGGYEAESYLMEPWAGPWTTGMEISFIPQLVTQPPKAAHV